MARYAEGTSVPMERSRVEAEKTLVRYGASGFAYSWEHREQALPLPLHHPWCPLRSNPSNPRPPHCTCGRPKTIARQVVIVGFKMKTEGGERRVQLEVPMPHELEAGSKAKAVASGISTLEAEFLANIVMEDGRTIGAAIVPRLSEAVAGGRLLPPAGGAA